MRASRRQKGQRRDPERGRDDAGKAVARLVDDDLAEPAASRDRGDRRRRDHEDGSDSNACDDQRQPERQLDLPENLRLREAHASRRLDDVAVDAVDTEVRVHEDRRNREHDERRGVVPEADAEDRQAERDQHDARQRAADVRHARGEQETAPAVTEPEPERQREHDRDRERGERELEVLDSLREQQMHVVAHEAERIDERSGVGLVGNDHAARVHGVRSRWTSTSSKSATSARAITSQPGGEDLGLEDVLLEGDEDRRCRALAG